MFDSGVTVGHEMMFYDYYTGVLLPDNDYFGGGSENSYYFEFETTGGWVDLYIDVTVGHKNDVGDYRFLSEFTITVNMPSWYDGLFVSVPPQPATYAETMERNDRFNNLDSFIPALELPWDVRNALNCGIW